MMRCVPIAWTLAVALQVPLVASPAVATQLMVPEDVATIEAALAESAYGDTVSLAVGTYYEHDLQLPRGVSIFGRGADPKMVVIDAQGAGRVIRGENLDQSNRLEGFTIRGGFLSAGFGCGAYLVGQVILRNLAVLENSSNSGHGIGVYAIFPTLIEDCVFRDNHSSGQEAQGGGLFAVPIPSGGTQIRRVDFIANQAHLGSALHVSGRPIMIEDVRALDNLGGAAVFFYDGEAGGGTTVFLENSLIANNEGRGVYVDADALIRGCTIVDCTGGGIYAGATWDHPKWVNVEDCIVAFNGSTAGGNGIDNNEQPWTAVHCSNVYKNLPANYAGMPDPPAENGNISTDPLFCTDAGPEAYPLRKDSPCAPANNTCGLLMGAFPVGCDATATEETSWSRIKSLY